MKKIAIIGNRDKFENYYAAIEACSAEAVTIISEKELDRMETVDGIVIPGGVDVNPKNYQEENTASVDIDDALDELELKILEKAVSIKKPILGICRGHQIINVFLGGTLIQNVEHCDVHKRENDADKVHMSQVEKDSFIYHIFQEERISTNSAHHQAVKKLGDGLHAVQYSDDKLIEAFNHENLPIYGVQWHPERMCLKHERKDTVNGLKVFTFFINEIC